MRTTAFILFMLFIGYSCKEKEEALLHYDAARGVIILNEGNFTYSNAAMSHYDPQTGKLENQVFYNANGFPLGDVAYSLSIHNGKAYAVINNSGKILVFNPDNFKHIATISGLTAPRHICFVSGHKAYVSDLYSPYISIMDPGADQLSGSIYLGTSSEQMLAHGDELYVCSWSGNDMLYRINHPTDSVMDSLRITKQPNSMVLDANNKLWLLSDGGYPGSPGGQVAAALSRVDAESFSIEQVYTFPDMESSPTRLCINARGDTLFFLNGSWGSSQALGGVYAMPVNAATLPGQALIPENGKLFYGLGVNPHNSDIYVSDAIDYMQQGMVYRYSAEGLPLDSFRADIIPQCFAFR